jgi:hypothetical protein
MPGETTERSKALRAMCEEAEAHDRRLVAELRGEIGRLRAETDRRKGQLSIARLVLCKVKHDDRLPVGVKNAATIALNEIDALSEATP